MSFRKELLLLLVDIREHLRGIRWEAERQTELLALPTDLATSEANDRAAITWQEAVKVLANECAKVSGCDCVLDKCPMRGWCSYARKGNAPAYWVVPLYEKEAASDE